MITALDPGVDACGQLGFGVHCMSFLTLQSYYIEVPNDLKKTPQLFSYPLQCSKSTTPIFTFSNIFSRELLYHNPSPPHKPHKLLLILGPHLRRQDRLPHAPH
jgi:hypothetical protein